MYMFKQFFLLYLLWKVVHTTCYIPILNNTITLCEEQTEMHDIRPACDFELLL